MRGREITRGVCGNTNKLQAHKKELSRVAEVITITIRKSSILLPKDFSNSERETNQGTTTKM